jgi:probable HAF family extracellular repeat protein
LGINDNGQAVGSTSLPGASTRFQAFLYTNGNLQVLTPPPSSNDAAGAAINSSGQVVVNVYPGFTSQTYLYSNGTLQQIDGLGGAVTEGHAINSQGQVVGDSGIGLDVQTRGGPEHAFLYSDGTTQDLGTLPGSLSISSASGINDAGEIVGQSTTASSVVSTDSDGFLYLNGTMYDLNTLTTGDSGYLITVGVAINASGQIAADAISPSGQEHAVLLSPALSPTATAVPLPAAAWASLTMLPLLLLGKRVRRLLA